MNMLSLSEMQSKSITELSALALASDNAQYSRALTQIAHAQTAYLSGDHASMHMHVSAAKVAYSRALEDEHGRMMRARSTAAVVEARGATLSAEVAGGKRVVKLGMSKVALWDLSWGTR